MITAAKSLCRRFADSTRGVAAIEFAMVAPVLVLLLLGSYDAENAIAIYMKVRSATYTLAAVTNQYGIGTNSISTTNMSAITGATTAVLAPYSSSPTVVILTQIKATSSTQATVSWSYAVNGTALTQGSSYTGLPTSFASNTCGGNYPCYVVQAKVSYTFTPIFGSFLTGPITFSDNLYVTPRVSACVQYNSIPATC